MSLNFSKMGLSGSKDHGEDFSTPPKIGTHRRIVDQEFDPRSPSVGIARTPIVVDKTPEGIIDPRSPTVGITRTPITTLSSNHGNYYIKCFFVPPPQEIVIFTIDFIILT